MVSPAFLSATRSRTCASFAAALEQLPHPAGNLAGGAPRGNRVRCQAHGLDHPDSVLLQNPPRRLPHGTGEYRLAIPQQIRQLIPACRATTGIRSVARLHQRGWTVGLRLEDPKPFGLADVLIDQRPFMAGQSDVGAYLVGVDRPRRRGPRSEEHTSELQ